MNAFGFLLPNRHSSATVCMSRNIHLYVPHGWGIDWIHSQKNVPKWSIHGQSVSGEGKNKVRSMLLIASAVGFCCTCRLRLPLNADENVKPRNTDEHVASSKFSITRKYQCLPTRETDLIKSHILHELPWSVCQQCLSVCKESLGIGTYSTLWNTVHSPCICRYLLTTDHIHRNIIVPLVVDSSSLSPVHFSAGSFLVDDKWALLSSKLVIMQSDSSWKTLQRVEPDSGSQLLSSTDPYSTPNCRKSWWSAVW